jgi:hypothetical protein
MQFPFLCLAVLVAPALAIPARSSMPGSMDIEGIQNRVRSGAIAIANADQPIDQRNQRCAYRNGDLVDTTIAQAPVLHRRQITGDNEGIPMGMGIDTPMATRTGPRRPQSRRVALDASGIPNPLVAGSGSRVPGSAAAPRVAGGA